MATFVDAGRVAQARAIKSAILHMAWGRGEPWWDETRSDLLAFGVGDTLDLARGRVSGVVIKSEDEATTFLAGTDYTVDDAVGRVTRLAGGAIPAEASVRVAYRTDRPVPSTTMTGLVDEIGRRTVTEVSYLTPDPAGSIASKDGARFNPSVVPTKHLLVRTDFAVDEGVGITIREAALFVDTVTDPGLPPGQVYFELGDIVDPGTCMLIENIAPVARDEATEQGFRTVIST